MTRRPRRRARHTVAAAESTGGSDGGGDLVTAVEEPRSQGAAARSRALAVALDDHAFLSDCHTGALVALDGSVTWLCVPRFDAPSIFGALADPAAGRFRLGPVGVDVPTDRAYEPGTNVLATTWHTPRGWAVVRDALTLGPRRTGDTVTPHTRPSAGGDADHTLVRTVDCTEGRVEIELLCAPMLDDGRTAATWGLVGADRRAADATGAGPTVRLQSDMALAVEGGLVRASEVLEAGDRVYCALSWADDLAAPIDADQADDCLAATTAFWRTWLGRMRRVDHRYRQAVERSALAIKGLSYMPTGATVTSLTAPRPEALADGGAGACRATSLGLSALVLEGLHRLDLDGEADAYMAFLADLGTGGDGGLRPVYGIDGRTVDRWSPAPVQAVVCGPVLDAILRHTRRRTRLDPRLWSLVQALADGARTAWGTPDRGMWAAAGPPRHHVPTKLLWWVALDRAAELATIRRDTRAAGAWRAAADEVRADVLAHGVDSRGVLRGCYDRDDLDAAVLFAAILGFWPGDDERLRATVLAVAAELVEDGLVVPSGAGAAAGASHGILLVCSFWLASALAIVGERQRAGDLMDRLVRLASPLGLYAARLDPGTAHHRGDFPQVASHLALVEAADRITLLDR